MNKLIGMPSSVFISRIFNRTVKSSFSPNNFKCKELYPDALNIRNTLIYATKQEFTSQKPSISSLFKLAPIENHLMNFRKYLPIEQNQYAESLDKICYQLVLKEHLPILKKFYDAKKKENSALGKLYSQMNFEEMLCRFVQKRYQAVYLDGRLLTYKSSDHEACKPLQLLSNREKILAVGSPNDAGGLYKNYLTIEESALSHLVFANGYYLAVSRAIRQESGFIANHTSQKMIMSELSKAHVGPILISYIVGPELRNGQSLHYDALMCLQYSTEKPGHPHYERRNIALQQQGFSSIVESLYGNEYPQGPKAKEECKIIPVKIDDGTTAYFYVNAYKNRLRHSLKQVIMAHELFMPGSGTMRLKGFGLGAFGMQPLKYHLENVFVDVLDEVLHVVRPQKIIKVELLNFPSMMSKYEKQPGDIEYYMQYSDGIKTQTNLVKYEEVEVVHLLSASLDKTEDVYLSTQICGDSMSRPGNEATIGHPPSSSDEAAMYYALAGVHSMTELSTLPPPELIQKILITDGIHAHKLDGTETKVDFKSVQCGHFREETTLKTRLLSLEEAISAMDHANKVYGVVASMKKENDYWTVIMTFSADFDRESLFETTDATPQDDTFPPKRN